MRAHNPSETPLSLAARPSQKNYGRHREEGQQNYCKKMVKLSARNRRTGNIPANINQRPALCHPFCHDENFVGYLFVHVILAAARADLCRDIFHDKDHAIPFERNGRGALPRYTVFTDKALHVRISALFLRFCVLSAVQSDRFLLHRYCPVTTHAALGYNPRNNSQNCNDPES